METMYMVVSSENAGGGLSGMAYAIFDTRMQALAYILEHGLGAKCTVLEC